MTKLEMLALSQPLSDLYTGLETDLLANIAEFLAAGTLDLPSSQWKVKMLAQLGALDKLNMQTIAAYAGIVPELLRDTLENAVLGALEELEPGFQQMAADGIVKGTAVPIEDTMEKALKAYRKQAKQSLNMVNTVMQYKAKSTAQDAIKKAAELSDKQDFLDMLNKAAGKAVTGIESRQAAMRQCIMEMSEKGIPAFVDKRGREWTPEAYVNMDIRTTVSNVAHQVQFERMEAYDISLAECDSHAGARPKCAKDQGKIYNLRGGGGTTTDLRGQRIRYYAWKSTSYGEPDGLLGINCGHHLYPFVPGVSLQSYFPYDEKENAELYEKLQKQRELERRVRKSRRECMMLEQTGDKEGLKKAKAGLNTRLQALRTYCDDEGLKYKPDRTAVVDYRKSMAGFVPADKKKRIAEIQGKGLDISGGSGIIETGELLARREHNIGAFSSLEMPMQKKTVTDICKKYGVDTSGLLFKIQRDEGLVGKPYFGLTDYDNIGRIDLLPEAFSNEEQLVRTILHERLHVLQLRKYGKEYCIANLDRMERQAYWFEDAMYPYLRKKVRQ